MKQSFIILSLLFALLAGCRKAATTTGQTATLALKDGTTVSGTITKSDSSSVTLQTGSGVVSTYPVSQVASINYGPAPGSATNAPPAEPPPQQAAATAPTNAAPAERDYSPAETFHTIPSGTTLAVRTDRTIDSKTATPDQTYPGVVVRDVLDSGGQVAIPRGANATLVIRQARAQGKIEGRSELAVDVAAVSVGGRQYRLETTDFVERGHEGLGANKRTAKFTGGGTVLGTIIGAVAGGGKGAAIGALSGAAAGAATQGLTRGQGVRIPAETILHFRLEAPIHIREMR